MRFSAAVMPLDVRLDLAREAYRRALRAAGAAPAAGTWRRLLRAARNLESARRDRQRREEGRAGAELPMPLVGVLARRLEEQASSCGGPSPEVARQWDRARALREQAVRLLSEGRALREALAALAPAPPRPRA